VGKMWPAGDGVWECGGDEAPFFFHIVSQFKTLPMMDPQGWSEAKSKAAAWICGRFLRKSREYLVQGRESWDGCTTDSRATFEKGKSYPMIAL